MHVINSLSHLFLAYNKCLLAHSNAALLGSSTGFLPASSTHTHTHTHNTRLLAFYKANYDN